MNVYVRGDGRSAQDVVPQSPCLRFAERRGASVDVRVRAAARTRSAPVGIEVSIPIHTEGAVTIVSSVLAPESILVPGVGVAIGIDHGKNVPADVLHDRSDLCIRAVSLGQGFGQPLVVLFTIITTFIISVMAYYVFIKFTPLSWIISGYRNSWLKLPFGQNTG